MKFTEKKVTTSSLASSSCNIFTISFMIALFFLSSCSYNEENILKEEIAATVDEFATHYFNFDFNNTLNACTPESRKWLSFISSNVLQEDIDILKAQKEGAWHETEDINLTSDTTATAVCKVFNFLKIDTLGRAGRMTEQATYKIPMVKRNGKWLVKMEGLPQNEKQNLD